MSEENMSKENITDNKSAAEPRFKIGDVVWTPRNQLINGNLMFMECRILALNYERADGKSVFSGYRIIDNDNGSLRRPETVFATKEECEAFIDRDIAPKIKELRGVIKELGELVGKESDEEEE